MLQRAESVTLAFLVLLETLSPEERAVFLLKDIFDATTRRLPGFSGRRSTIAPLCIGRRHGWRRAAEADGHGRVEARDCRALCSRVLLRRRAG
jgi:hypothetical protein